MNKLRFAIFLGMVSASFAASKAPPPIVSTDTNGVMHYGTDNLGNRLPDFSTCGYAGGDKDIPDPPVRVVVAPVKGDETARIQKAIDDVAGLSADPDEIRGTVLLLKGRHEISGGLLITNSGVVLRGQGMGDDGTILVATGLDRRTLIRVAGQNDFPVGAGSQFQVKDDYVPVGATAFHLQSTDGLKAGDLVKVIRPSTKEWIDKLGANDFGGGEGGGWKPGSRDISWDRVVKKIEGDLVTIDAPITTALETGFGGGYLVAKSNSRRIKNIGVENLRLESAFDSGNPKDENHSWCAITMEHAADAWVRQVTFKHFAGSAVAVYESCKGVTVEDCLSLAPVSEDGGYRRNTFFTMGQQTLFLRCFAENGRHDFSVGYCAAGPNAFVQCEASLPTADSGAIESWSSGTLFDNVRVDGQAISLGYRPGNNAGIGWAAANSVLWNCSASLIRCASPPGAQNWSFGSWASFEGDAIWRDSNGFVKPESLYAAQLAQRNKRRTQIMSRSTREATNPTLDEAAELIAAARQPPPQLFNYIAAAAKRNPIPTEPGNAKHVEENLNPKPGPQRTNHKISITNGWIVSDGKLLLGSATEVAWWRGNVHPGEAPSFGPALTRFVPGRIGRGFTDDLDEVANDLIGRGDVAISQHYGLWYERRRDDHERTRRIDGDVLPPFFEQPFARSGQGTAWDGLSKYDLTRFNPWYWSRLKQFADVCDERGLILFNQNFFQHNIIEAGAHWVDCPWRTANNINATGFPEPPPFAGDKRIFMAEQFYDVTNPVRRELLRGFIRHNLNNFTNNVNVIQFTGDEFTGPLHFMQLWLDTIDEWENGRSPRREEGDPARSDGVHLVTSAATRPIIGLSCTKDVQDAILADAKRGAVVEVIDFRYWWRTERGLYDPQGGKNLSPRQHERLWKAENRWKGGPPDDQNLAQMAQEYRAKYPTKAVIQNVGRSGWAYLCAGGSLPQLPRTTDARLLAAIPRMQPWPEASGKNRQVLREAGRQLLIYNYPAADRELDLSNESGGFRLNLVDPRSGVITAGESVSAGKKINLPNAALVWLTKE